MKFCVLFVCVLLVALPLIGSLPQSEMDAQSLEATNMKQNKQDDSKVPSRSKFLTNQYPCDTTRQGGSRWYGSCHTNISEFLQ